MPIKKTEITIGKPVSDSIGHENNWAFKRLTSTEHEPDNNDFGPKEANHIYKSNKFDNPALSEYEVAFSAAWEVCTPGFTPEYNLVTNDDGTGTEGVCVKKLDEWKALSDYNNSGNPITDLINDDELKPRLTELDRKRLIQELARILVMCYCLEEDDLHRKNIGIAKGEDGLFHIVKIDHDMSFYQSVASVTGNRRGGYRINDEHRFPVTQRDIKGFPVLTDANSHYWPTIYRLITAHPLNMIFEKGYKEKGYARYIRNLDLTNWFENLRLDPDFSDAANEAFFEFVNIKPEDVRNKINLRLGDSKPEKTSMVTGAFVARQAEIRSTLFAMPTIHSWLDEKFQQDQSKQDPKEFEYLRVEGNTPLHVALQTGDFRYLNLDNHKAEIKANIKNSAGETPLLMAIRFNNLSAIEGLLSRGAKITLNEIKESFFPSSAFLELQSGSNIEWADIATSSALITELKEAVISSSDPEKDIETILKDSIKKNKNKLHHEAVSEIKASYHQEKYDTVGEIKSSFDNKTFIETQLALIRDDIVSSLAEKKEKAMQCIQAAAVLVDRVDDLESLFKSVDSEQFKFIRQLNTDFWLIRQLRGSHGVTATYKSIHHTLKAAVTKIQGENTNPAENEKLMELANRPLLTEGKMDEIAGFFTAIHNIPEMENNNIRKRR